jgi:RNA polymerase sigma-70 factor (ECF subfamily)
VHDTALIERAQEGDRGAFETLVVRHQGAVYGYLRARVLQSADAEDMTQEAFLRAYEARARFDSSALVRPWLIGIARNLLREHARRLGRRKEVAWTELCLELEEVSPSADAVHEAVRHHLPECLQVLGPRAREAIGLRYGDNLRLTEIGHRLQRSEGAVKLLMFRARQALRGCLDARRRRERP